MGQEDAHVEITHYGVEKGGNMILPAYINVNTGGIPTLRSLSVTVTSSKVQYDFNNHRNVGRPYRGLLVINLAQPIPTGTTTTLPVVFTTSGGNEQSLIKVNGAPATVEDISGTGIYLVWYDKDDDYEDEDEDMRDRRYGYKESMSRKSKGRYNY